MVWKTTVTFTELPPAILAHCQDLALRGELSDYLAALLLKDLRVFAQLPFPAAAPAPAAPAPAATAPAPAAGLYPGRTPEDSLPLHGPLMRSKPRDEPPVDQKPVVLADSSKSPPPSTLKLPASLSAEARAAMRDLDD